MAASAPPVVVVGGGIVGLTAAYYLTRRGLPVTLVEKCAIACHSSGKAGGFLTDGDSGWHRGSIAPLAKHSFALHEELAQQFGAERIGHRRVRCIGRGAGGAPSPAWLAPGFGHDMGDQSGMAQVSPKKLMDALSEAVQGSGCEVVIGKAVGVEMQGDSVSAVTLQDRSGQTSSLPCRAAIFGMGAWASEMTKWFPDSALPQDTVADRYTSVIWDETEVGSDATMVFISDLHHVEIYPRADECYANGCPTQAELPDDPLEIVPPPQTVEDVKAETFDAVARLKDAKVLRTTACFLAGSDDGRPVVGLVPKVKNAVVACGGGCWGILNGPAMGQAAAALALGEEPPISLAAFDPARFDHGSSAAGGVGVPPKLRALLAQHPELAQVVQQSPEALQQLLHLVQQEDRER